jgi:tetratricopeptide (TPR) repeat protein
MGVVYSARQPHTGQEVAIKVVLAGRGADEAQLRRFQRESQALGQIRHPNVLAVHGAGIERGAPYLVTDLISGGSLQARLDRAGPLDPEEAVRIVSLVAQGLAAVHARGLLHRDLKPDNVLIDQQGNPRLADFGLVSELDPAQSRLTKTGALLGTPQYMSPEQARGERQGLGPASDVYGLGAVLYAALTGSPPARGSTLIEVLESVVSEAPTPPSRAAIGIPSKLEELCLRCLAKEPLERPASMEELVAALETVLDVPQTGSRARIVAISSGLFVVGGLLAGVVYYALVGGGPPSSPPPTASARPVETQASPQPTQGLGEEELARGNAHRAAGRLAEAIEAYDRSLALQPDLVDAWLFRSWTQIRTEDYEGAIEGYTRALALLPEGHHDLSSVHGNRALARMRIGDLARALPDLDAALELEATALGHCNRGLVRRDTGDREGALRDFARALVLDPGDAAGAQRARAELYFRAGRREEALADMSAVLKRRPDDPEAWTYRGRIQGARGKLTLALADFDQALLKDPKHLEARINRGRTRSMQGDVKGAEADFDEALRLAPRHPGVRNARGSHYAIQGRFAESEREFDKLVEATPQDSDVWYRRGNIRLQLRDYRGAREDFDQAISLDPRNALALGNRGALRAQLGDKAGARRDLEEALRYLPPNQSAAREAFQRLLQGL